MVILGDQAESRIVSAERRLLELGLELPEVGAPRYTYVPCVLTGNLLFVSGQVCFKGGELLYRGKVGADVTVAQGQEAARQCALNCLAVVRQHLGSLDRVARIVKLLGFVNSAPGFDGQPLVMNGASDLFASVFGDRGKHARSAIGASELPLQTPVEIEIVVEIEN